MRSASFASCTACCPPPPSCLKQSLSPSQLCRLVLFSRGLWLHLWTKPRRSRPRSLLQGPGMCACMCMYVRVYASTHVCVGCVVWVGEKRLKAAYLQRLLCKALLPNTGAAVFGAYPGEGPGAANKPRQQSLATHLLCAAPLSPKPLAFRPQTAPVPRRRKKLTEQEQLEEELRQKQVESACGCGCLLRKSPTRPQPLDPRRPCLASFVCLCQRVCARMSTCCACLTTVTASCAHLCILCPAAMTLQAQEQQPPSLVQATLMGCRVELDGGMAPKSRVKATTFPPDLSHSTGPAAGEQLG